MGKPEAQSGRVPTRFSSKTSDSRGALAAAEVDGERSGDDAFYRPPMRRAAFDRPGPSLGSVPFRERGATRLDGPDLDPEEDEPFLRSRRRVSVRRGILPRTRWGRVGFGVGAVALVGGLAWLGYAARQFAAHDPRFRIESSDNIQVLGNSQVTQAELLSVFGADMGRNVFFVPLDQRRAELERLPWVETATVMRLLPNQLRLAVTERTPIAFARDGSAIGLVDRDGVLLPMAPETMAAKRYSFPVVTGISANDPASTRAARMKIYRRFLAEIDSAGESISSQLSEVDLSDSEDVRVLVAPGAPSASPTEGNELLLHLGDSDFLARWRNYEQHVAEWKAQYPQLASVDLRYERQVVLGMRKEAAAEPAAIPPAKAADASASSSAPSRKKSAAAANPAPRPTPRLTPRPTLAKGKPHLAARAAQPQTGVN